MECDFCNTEKLKIAYKVPTTRRNLSVYICERCGLVQSFPKKDHVKAGKISISADADWGNIRYGKSFVSKKAIKKLQKILDFKQIQNCLDIGSNRGAFVLELSRLSSKTNIVAIEPDNRILDNYRNVKNIELINNRFEKTKLEKNIFDLVYCSHTLEHLKSPKKSLKKIFDVMRPEGILYLEVPDINAISNPHMIEEWFIDKHLYHFSPNMLKNYLEDQNFRMLEMDASDGLNIIIIAKKSVSKNLESKNKHASEFQENFNLVKNYKSILKNNHIKLRDMGLHINKIAKEKNLVIWGAGRIFDQIIKIGKLDLQLVNGLVDKFLSSYLDEIRKVPLRNPDQIDWKKQDIVFISSREFFDEIKKEVRKKNRRIKILSLKDFF